MQIMALSSGKLLKTSESCAVNECDHLGSDSNRESTELASFLATWLAWNCANESRRSKTVHAPPASGLIESYFTHPGHLYRNECRGGHTYAIIIREKFTFTYKEYNENSILKQITMRSMISWQNTTHLLFFQR